MRLGQPEVQDLGLPRWLGNEEIGGLNVAVHNALGVRGRQCAGDLTREI